VGSVFDGPVNVTRMYLWGNPLKEPVMLSPPVRSVTLDLPADADTVSSIEFNPIGDTLCASGWDGRVRPLNRSYARNLGLPEGFWAGIRVELGIQNEDSNARL
jgi:hypothetical protein